MVSPLRRATTRRSALRRSPRRPRSRTSRCSVLCGSRARTPRSATTPRRCGRSSHICLREQTVSVASPSRTFFRRLKSWCTVYDGTHVVCNGTRAASKSDDRVEASPAGRAGLYPSPRELAASQASSQSVLRGDSAAWSFVYGGQPSSVLLPRWRKRTNSSTTSNTTSTITTWTDSAGFSAMLTHTAYADTAGESWVLGFRNDGAAPSEILEQVYPLDMIFGEAAGGGCTLHHARGSLCGAQDFEPLMTRLGHGPGEQDSLYLEPSGGRSSNGVLPNINLQCESNGAVIGIGWTGQWSLQFSASGGQVRARAGMNETHLRLYAGEQIRTPSILAQHYSGHWAFRGQNLWRRLVKNHWSPPNLRESYFFASMVAGWFGASDPCNGAKPCLFCYNQSRMLEGIANLQRNSFPYDAVWIDAGWAGFNDKNTPGDTSLDRLWEPQPSKFPDMRALSTAMQKSNAELMVCECLPSSAIHVSLTRSAAQGWSPSAYRRAILSSARSRSGSCVPHRSARLDCWIMATAQL